MLPEFSTRAQLSELMDDPDCCEELLLRTIRQFTSINLLVSRYRTVLRQWVLAEMRKAPQRSYHLLDMGAGGCDIDAWLLRTAQKQGLNLRITACDIDPRIIGHARKTFDQIPGLTIRQFDLLEDEFNDPVDFMFANHFLHHLTEKQIIHLLQRWHPAVSRRIVISDLLRDRWAYLGFWLFSLGYRKSFTRPDGLTSIQRAFHADELEAIARKALPNAPGTVHSLFPGRLVLCIEGTAANTAVSG